MVRAHDFSLAVASGCSVSPLCNAVLRADRRRRDASATLRSKGAFLWHLSEHCGQRAFLGTALRRFQSAGLRPVVCRAAYCLWRVSRLGPDAPAVCLCLVCRLLLEKKIGV